MSELRAEEKYYAVLRGVDVVWSDAVRCAAMLYGTMRYYIILRGVEC